MSPTFDPSDDFAQIHDALETVTLRRRGSSTQTIITAAARAAVGLKEATFMNRSNSQKEAGADGQYTASDTVWHLSADQLADSPALGDTIVDAAGRRWTVLDVRLLTLQSRWRCVARDLAIAHGLDDTIDIIVANYAKTDGGAVEPTWQVWKTGIRARVQPIGVDMTTERHARRAVERFHIFVEEDLSLDHTHRIRSPNGTVYRIRGTNGADRIGELMKIDAERIT